MNSIMITGANRGLGLEFVKQYAAAKHRVIACCRHPEKSAELQALKQQYGIEIIPLDLQQVESIHRLPSLIKESNIDILINNAGINTHQEGFGHITHEAFAHTLHINTIAPVLVSQVMVAHLEKSSQPIIVNISSFLASIELNTDPNWSLPIYRVSKSALNSATKCIATSLKEKNITVIAMDPGWVQTDMGGANADLTPAESIAGMRQVIEKLTLAKTGEFLRYDGSELPW